FFVHQLRDSLDQRGAVNAIRNLRDDYLFTAALEFFYARFAAYLHTAAASLEVLADPTHTADHAAGRKVRPLHMLHQLVQRDVGIIDLRANAVYDLAQIVRRNIRRHPNSNAGSAIDE